MAWEARLGLKPSCKISNQDKYQWLNGLGSPFGIETSYCRGVWVGSYGGLNGLGSPFGIETILVCARTVTWLGLNGLGSPFGIETQSTF